MNCHDAYKDLALVTSNALITGERPVQLHVLVSTSTSICHELDCVM